MLSRYAAKSGSSLRLAQDTEGEIEGLVEQLQQGSAEDRGLAAEKLFNKAAENEQARQKAAAIGVIQPLVSDFSWVILSMTSCLSCYQ